MSEATEHRIDTGSLGGDQVTEEAAEALASAEYQPHRFGDTPAWFAACVRLAKRALTAEAALAQKTRECEELREELNDEYQEHERTIRQRDDAEETIANAYLGVTGCEAVWSNLFGYDDALNGICAQVEQLGRQVAELQRELRQERGLKALLANGMPPTGNPAFDEILATHPVAAMIQRGWLPGITGFDDLPALESAICHFWGVKTIEEAVNPKLDFASRARTK